MWIEGRIAGRRPKYGYRRTSEVARRGVKNDQDPDFDASSRCTSQVMIHQPSVEISRAVASDILIKSNEMQDTKVPHPTAQIPLAWTTCIYWRILSPKADMS